MKRTRMSEDQIKALALDVYNGLVFTSDHVPESDTSLIRSIFLPWSLVSPDQLREWYEQNRPYLLYEYYTEAQERSINGYPVFMSVRYLDKIEYESFIRYYQTTISVMDEARRRIMEGPDEGHTTEHRCSRAAEARESGAERDCS